MVRIAKFIDVFILLQLIMLLTIGMSNAYPHLTPINSIEWKNVTDSAEAYQDNATNQKWITLKMEISPGNWNSSIENESDGMINFKWRSDKKISKDRFRSIEFRKNNKTELLSCDPKKNIWNSEPSFYYNKQNGYILYFKYSMGGTIWIAFPPQVQTGINCSENRIISERISCSDLENLAKQPIDLNGRKFCVQTCENIETLFFRASNFSIEPLDGQCILLNITLYNTSKVVVSNFIIRGKVTLERSKDCTIRQNTIFVSDEYALYLGNDSSNNQILENLLISNTLDNDDPVVYFYRSNSNNVTDNIIDSVGNDSVNFGNGSVNYYLLESFINFLTMYPGPFFANRKYYRLDENCSFHEFNGLNNQDIISLGSKIVYKSFGSNSWKCG